MTATILAFEPWQRSLRIAVAAHGLRQAVGNLVDASDASPAERVEALRSSGATIRQLAEHATGASRGMAELVLFAPAARPCDTEG